LQQQTHLMVTAALGINQLGNVIDVMASTGTDLAVQPSDEV
jgi:RecA/RadA recombinase